jgi:predicted lactoylglutathione lyase
MSNPDAIMTLVTLGVRDLANSTAFYVELGFKRKARNAEGVAFFSAGSVVFAVFPIEDLAKDAGLDANPTNGFRGVALAWNCRSESEVDAAYQRALRAGAKSVKTPQKAFWGGYQAYFSDPDGHLWEVAHNPHFPLSSDGRMQLPD